MKHIYKPFISYGLKYYSMKIKLFIECDKGSFGIDCNETCGYCYEANHCFHTNGTCLSGCIAGFQGDLCKTSK